MSQLVREAVHAGARQERACAEVGVHPRTLQRWRRSAGDRRGLSRPPSNRLSEAEVAKLLSVVNSPEFRDSSPKQIVPALADRNEYLASESTIYRVLRARGLMTRRSTTSPAKTRRTREHRAQGPNQVWSWDITYLRTTVRGRFYYLYLMEDVWSRKIVGWALHEHESPDLAAELVQRAYRDEKVATALVLHSDNGTPMRGSTMVAMLHRLGVVPSLSRPRVSNDNPFSESLFRTLKYRPNFPGRPFESLATARTWVDGFVCWYNTVHLHSGIRFTTPAARHLGLDAAQLDRRDVVYQEARRCHPERWASRTRNWSRILEVVLNPDRPRSQKRAASTT